jgi:recombination protein RecR
MGCPFQPFYDGRANLRPANSGWNPHPVRCPQHPEKLRINELLKRLEAEQVKEIIIALSSSQEGEATSQLLSQKLAGFSIKLTRLARGMPVAANLEYLDQESLKLAIEGRKEI